MRYMILVVFWIAQVSTYAQIDYTSFQGKESAIVYSKVYKFVNLFSYGQRAGVIDSVVAKSYGAEVAEEAIVRKHAAILQANVDSVVNKILLRSRLTVEI